VGPSPCNFQLTELDVTCHRRTGGRQNGLLLKVFVTEALTAGATPLHGAPRVYPVTEPQNGQTRKSALICLPQLGQFFMPTAGAAAAAGAATG
jgi:hypothetical protein